MPKPNTHKRCGGKFVKIERSETQSVYRCQSCGAQRRTYHRKVGSHA